MVIVARLPNGASKPIYFISYTQSDLDWAERINWVLTKAGFETIVQFRDCRAGNDFTNFMRSAASRADHTLCVLSVAYLKSSYGQQELNAAMAADPLGNDRRLIPVRVEECAPEELLRNRVYIDLANVPEQEIDGILLRGLADDSSNVPASNPPPVRRSGVAFRQASSSPASDAPQAGHCAPNDLQARRAEIQRCVECDEAEQALKLLLDFVNDFAKDRSLVNKVILLKRNYRHISDAAAKLDYDAVLEKTGKVLLDALELMDQVAAYGRAA